MRIRLGDDDRERLGCPEWLIEDRGRLSVIEADLLERAGIEPERALAAVFGEQIFNDDGTPATEDGMPLYKVSMLGWRIRVWLALRRAGTVVPFDELDYNVLEMTKEPDQSAGKDEVESSESETDTTP